MAILINK